MVLNRLNSLIENQKIMRHVKLNLEDDLARRLEDLSDDERREISKMISIWLVKKKPRPVLEVIDEVSAYAKEQGLTQEILDELLKKEN